MTQFPSAAAPLRPPSPLTHPQHTNNSIISHGAAAFLKERLFDQSDAYRIHVCEKSGLIAIANLKKQQFSSPIHQADAAVAQVFVPYACKLLFQELMAMCIAPRLRL